LSVPLHLIVLPFVFSGGKNFRNLSGMPIIVVDTRKTDAKIRVSGKTKHNKLERQRWQSIRQ